MAAARYVLRRCGFCALVVWLALTANFLLARLGTPDISRPRGEAARTFGLDQPLWQQYVTYLTDLAHLNMNYSLSSYPMRVADQIGAALPWTVALLGTTAILAWAIGTLLGALLALPGRPRWISYVFPPLMVMSAAPYFIIGMLLLYALAFRLQLFPLGGGYDAGSEPQLTLDFILNLLRHAALPALSIVLVSIATWSISMRALVVSLDGEDFLTFAHAKGLKRLTIFVRYAIRNAIPAQLTALSITLAQIATGGLLVEAIFRYPGLGGLLYRAILARDYFLEQGIVLMIVISISLATLILDLVYPLLDPRLTPRERHT
ncbi:MAG: ABC transporter permease [Chloroflexi bacterium]|nr:ABC transporter permease [Chloroflexota bacterium]